MKQVRIPVYSAPKALEVGNIIFFKKREKQVRTCRSNQFLSAKWRKGANPTSHKHIL